MIPIDFVERLGKRVEAAKRVNGWPGVRDLLYAYRHNRSCSDQERAYATILWTEQQIRHEPFRIAGALEVIETTLPHLRDIPKARVAAIILGLLVCRYWGDYKRAREYIQSALDLLLLPEIQQWHGRLLLAIAHVEYDSGNFDDAKAFANQANAYHESDGYGPYDFADRHTMLTDGLSLLGEIALDEGAPDTAQAVYLEASQIPSISPNGRFLLLQARLALSQLDWGEFDRAMAIAIEPPTNGDTEMEYHALLSHACYIRGELVHGDDHHRIARETALTLCRMGFLERLQRLELIRNQVC